MLSNDRKDYNMIRSEQAMQTIVVELFNNISGLSCWSCDEWLVAGRTLQGLLRYGLHKVELLEKIALGQCIGIFRGNCSEEDLRRYDRRRSSSNEMRSGTELVKIS